MSFDADYSWRYVDGSDVHIVDKNLGNRSVTNDAEGVLERLHQAIDLTGRRVTYTDTDGQIDQLLHTRGVFCGFAPCRDDLRARIKAQL